MLGRAHQRRLRLADLGDASARAEMTPGDIEQPRRIAARAADDHIDHTAAAQTRRQQRPPDFDHQLRFEPLSRADQATHELDVMPRPNQRAVRSVGELQPPRQQRQQRIVDAAKIAAERAWGKSRISGDAVVHGASIASGADERQARYPVRGITRGATQGYAWPMIPAVKNTARLQAAGGLRTLSFESSMPLQLASGVMFAPLTMAFETYGALNSERSNAVLVCHDLMHDQFVAAPNPVTGRPAWWPRIVGPGRPIDTNRFYVIAANTLGGCMGSSGPAALGPDGEAYAMRFPAITVADMVRAQIMLIEALDVRDLFLVIGPGLGGMQALHWAAAHPKRVFASAAVATAAERSAHSIALNELGRRALMADPDWRKGAYLAHGVRPAKGLSVARLAAQLANFTAADIAGAADGVIDFADPAVGSDRFDANAFIYLTRAMDQFDLAEDFGGALANAFSDTRARTCVFSFANDWRYPPPAGRAIARALIGAGVDAAYAEIDSPKGHEAFLSETPEFEAALTGFIDAAAVARGLALHGA